MKKIIKNWMDGLRIIAAAAVGLAVLVLGSFLIAAIPLFILDMQHRELSSAVYAAISWGSSLTFGLYFLGRSRGIITRIMGTQTPSAS